MFELKQVHVLRLLHALKVKGAFQEEYYFGIQASSLSKHNLSQNKICNPFTRVFTWSFLSPVLPAIVPSGPHMYLLHIFMEGYRCYWRHKWIIESDCETGEQDTELKNMAW